MQTSSLFDPTVLKIPLNPLDIDQSKSKSQIPSNSVIRNVSRSLERHWKQGPRRKVRKRRLMLKMPLHWREARFQALEWMRTWEPLPRSGNKVRSLVENAWNKSNLLSFWNPWKPNSISVLPLSIVRLTDWKTQTSKLWLFVFLFPFSSKIKSKK